MIDNHKKFSCNKLAICFVPVNYLIFSSVKILYSVDMIDKEVTNFLNPQGIYKQFSDSTSINGIMSVITFLCAILLLVSSSSAESFNKSWNNTVIYQIYVKSFYDSNGDGIGDLKGITSKLPYIADTGINAISLSSVYDFKVDSEYDITNYTGIDPILGTIDDFKTLVAEAHKLGLKVIIDAVPNYSSDKYIWFQKALQGDEKYKGYYILAEGKNKDNITPPNNWISIPGGSAWTYVDSLKQWYLHQYGPGLPDLNYSNPDLLQEIQKSQEFWLDTKIDGFNLITAPYIFEDKELRDEPRSYAPGATPQDYNYLDHIYTVNQNRTYEYLESIKIHSDQYTHQLNEDPKLAMIEAYTEFPHTIEYYNYDLLPSNFGIIKHITANSPAELVKEKIDHYINLLPSGKIANWVIGNSDYSRLASRFSERLDQMTMLSMILPGIAVTYYGDEIGMVDGKGTFCKDTVDPETCNTMSRTPEKTPFQWDATRNAGFSTASSTWLPVNPNYQELNLENEMGIKNSHYNIYKDLAHLHGKEPALTEGSYTSFITNNGAVLGVIRNSGDRYVLLLINYKDDMPQNVDLSDHHLPETMKLKVACSGAHSSLKQQVDTKNIYLPMKAAVVYTSLNIQ